MNLLNLPRIFGKKETEEERTSLSEQAIVSAQEKAWHAVQVDDDQKRRQAYNPVTAAAQAAVEAQRAAASAELDYKLQEAAEKLDQKKLAKDLEEHWQSLVDYFLMVEDPLELGDHVPYKVEHAWIKKDKPALILKIDLLSEPMFCALPESEPADLIQVAKALKLFVTSHYQPVTAEEVVHW